MAHIPELSDDLEIISKLGDTPNTDNGLTSDELKAKFDLAATLIKSYINKHIVPTINSYVASNDGFLKRAGGTMEGILNMGRNRISDVSDPVDDGDAVNKRSALLKSGGTMAGQLSLGGFKITDLGAPEGAGDGVGKGYLEDYVNQKTAAAGLFSPVVYSEGTSFTISRNESGKTLIRNSATDCTFHLGRNESRGIPIGTEIAISELNWGGGTVYLHTWDGVKTCMAGEYIHTNAKYHLAERNALIGLKKIGEDQDSDYWLITGPVEVVE